MSIRSKYEEELSFVFNKLIDMCHATEFAIEQSISALKTKDRALAKEVIDNDKFVDEKERDIESDCLRILLMEHPFASDFRDVSAALKVITDLERIADQAADIAEIFLHFSDEEFVKEPEHIDTMAKLAVKMVRDGVQSYINRDIKTAAELDKRDDRIDELFKTVKDELVLSITKDPSSADSAVLFLMIAKYLERIGDHAVNIGEWAEYAVTGKRF